MIAEIYAIVDVGPWLSASDAVAATEGLLAGGLRTFQLRAKAIPDREHLALSRALRSATARVGASLIVNDRPDIAVLAKADGVHLGQMDLPPEAVRPWLPSGIKIGLSCHTAQEVAIARNLPVDYVGFGPIYGTETKSDTEPLVGPEKLAEVCRNHPDLPVVAIGGICGDRIEAVRQSGAHAAAMASGLLKPGTYEEAARTALTLWRGSSPCGRV